MQYFQKYITSIDIFTKLKQLKLSLHGHNGIKRPNFISSLCCQAETIRNMSFESVSRNFLQTLILQNFSFIPKNTV